MESTPAPRQHRLTLNKRGVVSPLARLIAESTENVSVGLAVIERYTSTSELIPKDYIPVKYSEPVEPGRRLPRKEVRRRKDNFKTWILTRGFEECSKALLACLREAYLFVEVSKLSFPMTMGEFQPRFTSIRKRSRTRNFPQLLEAVTAGLTKPAAFAEHVESINKARNCLEHRNGIVGREDINDQATNSLVVKWNRMRMVHTPDDGGEENEVWPGDHVDKGVVTVGYVDQSKSFALSESISFTAAEFNDIAHTCQIFANDIAEKLPVPPEPTEATA